MTEKALAYRFLKTLQERLNSEAPPPEDIKSLVDASWTKPKAMKTDREKLESKENLAFYKFAAPQIFALGKETANLSDAEMRRAFRCVYYGKYPELSAVNSFRKRGHPFSKRWGLPSDQVMLSWHKTPSSNTPANQAWPEAALGRPFPLRVLFEAKYFDGNSSVAAESDLVSAIYETVFYRGLPAIDDWGYEFGCLLAYDVFGRVFRSRVEFDRQQAFVLG